MYNVSPSREPGFGVGLYPQNVKKSVTSVKKFSINYYKYHVLTTV